MINRLYKYLLKSFNSFESVFQVTGAIIGFVVSILLLVSGMAAIPFTGGASLLPMWLGALIFTAMVTTTFLAAGRMTGITLDIFFSKEKSNNEKLATGVAVIAGIVIAILAMPLNYVTVPFLATTAMVSLRETLLIFFPWMISTVGSMGRHIGRTLDKLVLQKITLPDMLRKAINTFLPEQPKPGPVKIDIKQVLENADRGIENYITNSVQGVLNIDTGMKRVDVYLQLMRMADTDLQKTIILYTCLLETRKSPRLKMAAGGKDYAKLRADLYTSIKQQVQRPKDLQFLETHVISKLGMFANRGKELYNKDKELKEGYRLILNNLNDARFRN